MPLRYTTKQGQVRWRARWRTGSGERQSRSGFQSEQEARAHEEAMRTVRRQGQPLRRAKTRITLNEYWERWWREELIVAKARATQYSYRDTYASYIAPRIGELKLRHLVDEPQLLIDWRSKLIKDKSPSAFDHAQRVLSSMLSAAAEEGAIPHNPLLLLSRQGRRGRARTLGRSRPRQEPLAIDPTAWFLVLEYLRRATRPSGVDGEPRSRRYPLDRERDGLIVALGFMAGLRLPSEALGLAKGDVRAGRLHVEGRSSLGEYVSGSKTGPGRDLPLRPELAVELERVQLAYRDASEALGPSDFWISARRDRGIWTEHQASNWRRREFRPVVREVARDFSQFSDLARATPYATRHTFISCCLQAGMSLATIAAWCGTSIQMISATYGRMIRRYEGASAVSLEEQFRAGKVEAVSLLSASSKRSKRTGKGGPTGGLLGPAAGQGGPTGGPMAKKLPSPQRRKVAV
jgi:integrase